MALMRYINARSPRPVNVRVLGEDYGLVAPGEAIPVPDDVLARTSWPAANWELVTTTKEARK